jgi:hypothetical protein
MPRSVSTDHEYKENSVDIPERRLYSMPRSVSTEYRKSTDNMPYQPRSISKEYSVDENHNKDYHGNQEPIETCDKHDDLSPYVIGQSCNKICMLYNKPYVKPNTVLATSHEPKNITSKRSSSLYFRKSHCEIILCN